MLDRPVTVDACAKLNLRLAVLARESSGFHSLETLFCATTLSDELQIVPGEPGIRLHVEGAIDVGPPEQNLVTRAAERFYDLVGVPPAVQVRLEKRIPSAAGLGGGSSDAAATLRALNLLHDHPLSGQKLLEIGATLGSDVPFFLTPTPFALAWGRGQRLLQLPPLPPKPVVIANPGAAMSTPVAFSRLADLRGDDARVPPLCISLDALRSWDEVTELAMNDLEFVAFEHLAHLPNAIRSLHEAGARIALLAGSGASIFGIFDDQEQAEAAAGNLSRFGYTCWLTQTLAAWPDPRIGIDPNTAKK